MKPFSVCVVGAGSSGIAACKVLRERGVAFVCIEVGSGIGGNWRYQNDNGMSSAYRSLHINTSRDRMAYSDFPMPEGYPQYPSHAQILVYFEDYVDHFGFRDAIRFRTRVEHVEPLPGGGFEVTTRSLPDGVVRVERFEAVLVANGHHWDPRLPDWPGDFDGQILHSHDYRTPDVLADRDVVVVGIGNSATDIASEAVRHAASVTLSIRRSAHIVPKYLLGRPSDTLLKPALTRLPFAIQRRGFGLLLRLLVGRQERYGLPTPEHPVGSEHPTISSSLLDHVGHGRIAVRPEIERLDGGHAVFADGSRRAADLIVAATGYRITVPFLSPEVFDAVDNRVELYRHVVHPDIPGLYFVGLVQPLGAIMPLAEAQSEWIADLLTGLGGLPDRAMMWESIDRTLSAMRKRFTASSRHTVQVDFYPYLREIARERRRARRYPKEQAVREG